MKPLTLDEFILTEYQVAYPLPDHPTPFQAYSAGFYKGMDTGQVMNEEFLKTKMEQVEAHGFKKGEAQGIAYSAFAASHMATADIHAQLTPEQAATQMRDNIVATLELARNLARTRAGQ